MQEAVSYFMNCSKCGQPIVEGKNTLCPNCMKEEECEKASLAAESAEAVQPNPAAEQAEGEGMQPTELPFLQEEKPKKNKKKIALFSGIVAAVLVLCAAVGIALSWKDLQRNFFDPQKFIVRLEKKNVKSLSSEVAASFTAFSGESAVTESGEISSMSFDGKLKLVLGDKVLSLMNIFGAGTNFDWMKDISFDFQSDMKGNQARFAYALFLSGQKITNFDVYMDSDGQKMVISAEELNDKALGFDFSSFDMDEAFSANSIPGQVFAVLSEEEIEGLINDTMQIVFNHVQMVERGKETVMLGGKSEKLTSFRITFSEKDFLDIGAEVLETMKNDERIEKLYSAMAEYDAEIADTDLKELIDDAIDSLKEQKDEIDEDSALIMTDFVNRNNEIVGRSFAITEDGEEEEMFSWLTVSEKNDYFLAMTVSGEEFLTGRYTEENEKVNGEFALEFDGKKLAEISLVDVIYEEGNESGTMRLQPVKGFWELCEFDSQAMAMIEFLDPSLEIRFSASADEGKGAFEFTVLSGKETLFGMKTSIEAVEAREFSIPTDYVDASDEDAVMEWYNSLRLDTILENLRKAGLPTELLGASFEGVPA